MYFCYCFRDDGKYDKPEVLNEPEKVLAFVSQKCGMFPRIIVTDDMDFTVLEVEGGKLIFPKPEDIQNVKDREQSEDEAEEPTIEEKCDRYIDKLNKVILPGINYEHLHQSYNTADKHYAKHILKDMHEEFLKAYGTDCLNARTGDFAIFPAVIKGGNSGQICIGLVGLDLSSAGEHCSSDFLTLHGVLTQGSKENTKAIRDFIDKNYIPYDYYYTVQLENDIHVDLEEVPEEVREMLDYCHEQQQNHNNGMEFGGI